MTIQQNCINKDITRHPYPVVGINGLGPSERYMRTIFTPRNGSTTTSPPNDFRAIPLASKTYPEIAKDILAHAESDTPEYLLSALGGIIQTRSLLIAFMIAPELLIEFDPLCQDCPARRTSSCLPIVVENRMPRTINDQNGIFSATIARITLHG